MNEREAIREALQKNPKVKKALERQAAAGFLKTYEALDSDAPIVVVGGATTTIDDSIQEMCACGRRLWLSPSTQDMLTKHKGEVQFLCGVCFVASKSVSGGVN